MYDFEIEKGFEMVSLEGVVFLSDDGMKITFNRGAYGFKKNGMFVAKRCKSAGGSNEPMAYNKKVALELIKSGFVRDELSYCKSFN